MRPESESCRPKGAFASSDSAARRLVEFRSNLIGTRIDFCKLSSDYPYRPLAVCQVHNGCLHRDTRDRDGLSGILPIWLRARRLRFVDDRAKPGGLLD